MMKVILRVPDMHCSNCAMNLESIEDDLSGVKRIKASYHKQLMEVEYDENLVTVEQIILAAQAKGYHPEPV